MRGSGTAPACHVAVQRPATRQPSTLSNGAARPAVGTDERGQISTVSSRSCAVRRLVDPLDERRALHLGRHGGVDRRRPCRCRRSSGSPSQRAGRLHQRASARRGRRTRSTWSAATSPPARRCRRASSTNGRNVDCRRGAGDDDRHGASARPTRRHLANGRRRSAKNISAIWHSTASNEPSANGSAAASPCRHSMSGRTRRATVSIASLRSRPTTAPLGPTSRRRCGRRCRFRRRRRARGGRRYSGDLAQDRRPLGEEAGHERRLVALGGLDRDLERLEVVRCGHASSMRVPAERRASVK